MVKNIIKGIVIGSASLLPGVSGGTMAVSMGIYDKVIHAINHLLTDTKNSVKFLMPILFGVGISMLGSVFGIDYLFTKFPVEFNLLFTGLILGGLPAIYKKANEGRKGWMPIGIGVLFGLAITIFVWCGETKTTGVILTLELTQMVLLFLIGILAAATLIIPGVSGSMLLLLLGYYQPMLEKIKNCISGVMTGNWNLVGESAFILLPFGVGIALGILALAKLVDYIFENYPVYAYWCILGLIGSSPIVMLKLLLGITVTWMSALIGGILLIFGYKIGETWG